MNFCTWAASVCLGASGAALLMAEFGLSSLLGNWHPTHQAAIAYGVLSIAFSSLGRLRAELGIK